MLGGSGLVAKRPCWPWAGWLAVVIGFIATGGGVGLVVDGTIVVVDGDVVGGGVFIVVRSECGRPGE